MLNLSKSGQNVYILYGAKNYGNGETVVANIYDGSNSLVSGSPFTLSEIGSTGLYGNSFSPSATGEYKIKVTEGSNDRAHASIKVTDYDIESVGGDVTTIKDVVEHATYGNEALKDKLVGIEGSGFATGTDSLKAIKDYLVNTIQSAISGIQNNTRTSIAIPTQMLKPTSGSSVFKCYVDVYDTSGNMEDPDDQDAGAEVAMISVTVVDESANDRSANLGGLSASTQDSKDWLTRDAEGKFSFTYSVSNTHDLEQLIFTFDYEESSAARSTRRTSVVTDVLDISDQVDNIYDEVTSVTYGLSALKTLIDTVDTVVDGIQTDLDNGTDGLGAIKTAVDANQTDLTNIESKIDTVDTVVDSNYSLLTDGTYGLSALQTLLSTINTNTDTIETDLTAIKGSGFATGTDSLKAIRDAIDAIDVDVNPGGYIQ